MMGIVQSKANRQLDEIPPVIHLWTGSGAKEGNAVFFHNKGIHRHDDPKLAPCGKLDSVDIASTTASEGDEDRIPAAFLVDVEEASAMGHKLCGHCLMYHPDFDAEAVPEYQKNLDLDPAEWEKQKEEEAAKAE